MAMTGVRRVSVGLGALERTPPDVVVDAASATPERRELVSELFHWGFGAAAGALFPAVARTIRLGRWSGPAYGLAIWLGFEAVAAPVLGTPHARHPIAGRAALALDHALYGMVLGAALRDER